MKNVQTVVGFGLLLAGLAACSSGGGGGSPTVVDPTIPVIANLRIALGQPCTFGGLNGTVESLAVDYTDSDGNVRGGTVTIAAGATVGGVTVTLAIPSPGVTVTGTTSGTVTALSCLHFGSNSAAAQTVQIIDASGKGSNVLTTQIANPGLPLLLGAIPPRVAPVEG